MNEAQLENKINEILKNMYPLKATFDDISNLSHFYICFNNISKKILINMDINGIIIDGPFKKYKIKTVVTTTDDIYKWDDYIKLYIKYINKSDLPCTNYNYFINKLLKYNDIHFLNIHKFIFTNNEEYIVKYIEQTNKKIQQITPKINNSSNHFYFNSFNNKTPNLNKDIERLIENRDKYNNIHFHLEGNGGGDLIPVHLIIRTLVGKKQKWMRNTIKILKNKKKYEWDNWKEEIAHPDYFNTLGIKILPHYETKYNGKIYLYMDEHCGSSTWYFITYLIYAFSSKIYRYSKKCYGIDIKYGEIESKQLKLYGHSATTSGDGNSELININNDIKIYCPTEQFISCSVKHKDWNRFWVG
jgi:hypothetical protein